MSINFEQSTKHYNSAPVVNDVSLQIETGELRHPCTLERGHPGLLGSATSML